MRPNVGSKKMHTKVKSLIWWVLAIGLFVLSAFFFLMPLLFAADFLSPGSGIRQWMEFILAVGLVPLFLCSLGMICRNNANKLRGDCQPSTPPYSEPASRSPQG